MVEVWCLRCADGLIPETVRWERWDVEADARKGGIWCHGDTVVPCELVEVEHAERTENT